MNNKTASAPSKTASPTEMTLIKCSLNGHVSKRLWGAVIFASDFSALRVSLSECIKDAILRWLIDHSGFNGGERRLESYVMKRATVNTESPHLRKTLCSITLRNQIHAPNLFHDLIRERKNMAFPGINAFHKNQVACGQPPTHIVIEILRADVNHWEEKKFKTGAVLFQTVDGGAHVEGILFDELHTPLTGSANKRSGAGTQRECSTRLPDRSNRACSSHAPNRDSS